MPKSDLFRRLGVFALDNFIDPDFCSVIQLEMRMSKNHETAKVSREGTNRVDEAIRRTKLVSVSTEITQVISQRLMQIEPGLENHFGVRLANPEDLNFLAYNRGDFFKLHTDCDTSENAHSCIQKRKISIVLFLNGESTTSTSDSYEGGSLILYGLIEQPQWANYGFSIRGQAGLLIAFRSDIFHEVTPVTQGRGVQW
jgi:SM-20-related protein